VTERTPPGVRWISWLPGDGFGDAAVGYLGALDALGVPLTWTVLGWGDAGQPVERRHYEGPLDHLVGRAIDHDTVVVHLPPGHHDRWREEADGRRIVLCTTWESDRLTDSSVDACAGFDAVFVPSTFNQQALLTSGCPTPVHVVPHCARRISRVEPAHFERIGDRFTFYSIGPWTTRKAIAETVTAFLDAFDADDEVALIVKTSALDHKAVRAGRGLPAEGPSGHEVAVWPAFASLLAGRRNVPAIQLIAGHVPAREVDALHARGNCFFSLTRSEGWGLNIADALLFGHPVVVTGWGGHLDYLGGDYPLLVDYDLVPTADDPPDDWFSAGEGHRWARARHDHTVDVLRWVADKRDEAAAIGSTVGARLARDCAPDVIGRRLLSLVRPSS